MIEYHIVIGTWIFSLIVVFIVGYMCGWADHKEKENRHS